MMTPRPHQIKALDAIWEAMKCELNVLLEAPCSFGKTFVMCKIIQQLLKQNPKFRILILMDREILVSQTYQKLIEIIPELFLKIGIVCASTSKIKTIDRQITIASRQTFIKKVDQFEFVQLLIIDEIHMVPVIKIESSEKLSQFGTIIKTLRIYNPKMRMLGVTATPYRLGAGYIYGNKHSPGYVPYFKKLHHKSTVREILDAGYLTPLVGKTIDTETIRRQLNNLKLSDGEYNLSQLSDLMTEKMHIQSAVAVWKEEAKNRKKTIAYCTTIEHAELLAKAFNEASVKAITIHSTQSNLFYRQSMKDLKEGNAQVFCSVGKLTTGMDIVDLDCCLFVRPTKSTSLYKQILGRFQRLAPGKIDALILDMVGNNKEFGTDLDALDVKYKKAKTELNPDENKSEKPEDKACPECGVTLHPSIRICPECGYRYNEIIEADKPDMVNVSYGDKPVPECELLPVNDIFFTVHTSKKNDRELLRIQYEIDSGDPLKPLTPSLWLCFPKDGYEGYPIRKMEYLWEDMTGNKEFPVSAQEAYDRNYQILKPGKALVDVSDKWPEIKENHYNLDEDVPF